MKEDLVKLGQNLDRAAAELADVSEQWAKDRGIDDADPELKARFYKTTARLRESFFEKTITEREKQ